MPPYRIPLHLFQVDSPEIRFVWFMISKQSGHFWKFLDYLYRPLSIPVVQIRNLTALLTIFILSPFLVTATKLCLASLVNLFTFMKLRQLLLLHWPQIDLPIIIFPNRLTTSYTAPFHLFANISSATFALDTMFRRTSLLSNWTVYTLSAIQTT